MLRERKAWRKRSIYMPVISSLNKYLLEERETPYTLFYAMKRNGHNIPYNEKSGIIYLLYIEKCICFLSRLCFQRNVFNMCQCHGKHRISSSISSVISICSWYKLPVTTCIFHMHMVKCCMLLVMIEEAEKWSQCVSFLVYHALSSNSVCVPALLLSVASTYDSCCVAHSVSSL